MRMRWSDQSDDSIGCFTDSPLREGPLRRILVPGDSPQTFGPALEQATDIAAAGGGRVLLLYVRVHEPPARGGGPFCPVTSAEATECLAEELDRAWARGADASGVVRDAARERVPSVVAAEATEWPADLIISTQRLRWHGLGDFWSKISCDLARRAPCPVVLATRR